MTIFRHPDHSSIERSPWNRKFHISSRSETLDFVARALPHHRKVHFSSHKFSHPTKGWSSHLSVWISCPWMCVHSIEVSRKSVNYFGDFDHQTSFRVCLPKLKFRNNFACSFEKLCYHLKIIANSDWIVWSNQKTALINCPSIGLNFNGY